MQLSRGVLMTMLLSGGAALSQGGCGDDADDADRARETTPTGATTPSSPEARAQIEAELIAADRRVHATKASRHRWDAQDRKVAELETLVTLLTTRLARADDPPPPVRPSAAPPVEELRAQLAATTAELTEARAARAATEAARAAREAEQRAAEGALADLLARHPDVAIPLHVDDHDGCPACGMG